jgi:hypothetical protein
MPSDPPQPSQPQPRLQELLQLTELVEQLPPRPEVVQFAVRKLAQDTANIQWRKHAQDRRHHGPNGAGGLELEPGKDPGEWVIKLAEQMKSGREVGVVVSVIGWTKLRVITVEWEDWR